MKWLREHRLNQVVREYDPQLSIVRVPGGQLQLHRTLDKVKSSDYNQKEPDPDAYHPQYIFSLTHNFKLDGKPVDWGIEPLLEFIRSIDEWNHETYWDRLKRRDLKEEDQKRVRNNEFRAKAADLRKDFARATNDINTSTLEKVDRRRMSHGNC